jgi:hypothetical protein
MLFARAYIPKTEAMLDWKLGTFLGCHSIGNYGWIFTTINTGEKGYVKIR